MEVEHEGCGVGASGVESIAEVHEEGVATPTKAILNERVGELGLVEVVGSGDPDGVSRPGGDVGMFGWELVCRLSSKLEESGCFRSSDVLETGRLVGHGTYPQVESRLLVLAKGVANNAQGRGDGAEGRIGVVA